MDNNYDWLVGLIVLYILYKIIRAIFRFIAKAVKSKIFSNDNKKNFDQNIKNFQIDYTDLKNAPFRLKNILTNNEYLFYNELRKITDRYDLLIFPKVGLKDLFEVTDQKNYMKYFGKIVRKHLDFLICDKTVIPKFAIELDDKTHENLDRQESDKFKDILFLKNDLKLYRIKAKMSYTEAYILKHINIPDI